MRDVTHLDAWTHARLLRGDLRPDEARALARHLEAPCEMCEAFLAGRPEADGLDGRVDAALAALGGTAEEGNDLEFARIERRLREGPRTGRRPASIVTGLAGAAAAVLLVAGIAGLLLPRPAPERAAWDGLKGTARGIPVRLRFLVVAPGPAGRPALEKGVPGMVVSPDASLQFEVETGRAAAVALVRVPAGGAPEVFWSERVGEGRTTVSVGGRPAAYPLADLAGPQRFVLVASEGPLEEGRLSAAVRGLAPPARAAPDGTLLEGLSLDLVEVEVR